MHGGKKVGEKLIPQSADTTGNMIAEEIRKGIAAGQYKAGEKIKEADLCSKFGVSRTPVREAFRLLQNEGILIHNPQRGVFVPYLGQDEVMNLQQVRAALECLSARNAAPFATALDIELLKSINQKILEFDIDDTTKRGRLDREFHMTIANIGKNPYVGELLQNILSRFELSSYLMPLQDERIPHTHKEHEDIVCALETGDVELTEKYMEIHFRSSTMSLNRKLEKYLEETNQKKKRKRRK